MFYKMSNIYNDNSNNNKIIPSFSNFDISGFPKIKVSITGTINTESDFEEFNTAKCSIELTIISLKEPKSKFMASVAELVNIIFSLFVFIKFAIFNLAS